MSKFDIPRWQIRLTTRKSTIQQRKNAREKRLTAAIASRKPGQLTLLLCGLIAATLLGGFLAVQPAKIARADSTLPPPWVQNDIGYPISGNASWASGVYTVTGNGSTIGNGWDKFHYVSQPLNGDNSIVAHLAAYIHPGGGTGAKYGLMIRENLAPWVAGRNVMVGFNPTPGTTTGQLVFQYRTDEWANTTSTVVMANLVAPVWLKLSRTGNDFTAWTSPNGTDGSWTQAGVVTISMGTNANIGLAVASGDDSTLDTATFDHVKAPVNPSTLPLPWGEGDIGNPSKAGSTDVDNGVFSLNGNGSTIGGGWDKFHFVSQPFIGDGRLVARLANYNHPGSGTNARYGLMIRENLTPWLAGRNVAIAFNPAVGAASGQVAFQYRATEGGNTELSAGPTSLTPPVWFKLERVGNTFTGSVSSNGQAGSWTPVGSVTIPLGLNVWAGLVINSGDDTTLDSANFDNVTISDSRIGTPWQVSNLGYPAQPGAAAYTPSGIYSVSGSGTGFSTTTNTDQLQFTNRAFTSDGSITARLTTFTHSATGSPDGWYGLMLREDLALAGNNRYVSVGLRSSGQLVFQYRSAEGANSTVVGGTGLISGPVWLKLERTGNTFTGSVSSSGANGSWNVVGSVSLDLSASGYAGMAVASGDKQSLDTASFDSFMLAIRPVNMAINWASSLQTATRQSYGLNAFQDFNPDVASNPAYAAGMNFMKPGLLRYHSWEMLNDSSTANGWLDTAHQGWDGAKVDHALSALAYTSTVRLVNIPGWPGWMDTDNDGYLDADKFDAYAQFCADLVRIANLTYPGHHITYWEVTNERDDPYYVQLVNAGKPDRLNELIDIYNRAARAMKAVDSTIQVGGPAFARGDLYPQVQRFVAGTLNQGSPTTLDFLTFHAYASGDLHDSDTHIYDRAYNPTQPTVNSFTKHTADIRAILSQLSPGRYIPLWLDEYNISWTWQNNDPRMQNYKGGIFDALVMVNALKAGADATAAWNDEDGVYGKMDGSYTPRPPATVYHLLNNYMVGQTVATSQDVTSTVVVLAVKDDTTNRRSILLINRSPLEQTVNLSLKGWSVNSSRLDRYEFGPSGYVTSTFSLSNPVAGSITLPPDSVTVLSRIDQLLVTHSTDRGATLDAAQMGTLSYALGQAQPGQVIQFSLPAGGNVIAVSGRLAVVPPGITIAGKLNCADPGPGIVLDGSTAPPSTHGLELAGDDTLIGLTVRNFTGWQIKGKPKSDNLQCTVEGAK